MSLPINIDELLNGRTVEWERIEFRKGWNPERSIKTICAFANDFNNWGGGYLILGVSEDNGKPDLPPSGLQLRQIDRIQQELNNLCRKIIPNYFPIVEPVDYQNRKILVIWCPGGSNRPYKAPETLGNNARFFYFIRRFSSTVRPNNDEEHELLSMANQVPFDDQLNHNAGLSDFDLSSIKVFLNEIGSGLEKEISNLPVDEVARRMNIAEGANENLLPKNVGLLFFAKNPQKHFPSAKIEVVVFKDETGTEYSEKIFSGGLHQQLRNALDHLQNKFSEQIIRKSASIPESERIVKYPYAALEEALCNAVYHRGYNNDSTIEVRIYPNRIDIISFPGPLPPLDKEKLRNNQFDIRKYRNRRIGEFLKDLHLTEGRATGIPTIIDAMKKNG
ncbi:MAG TPA: AAA family ATPase, partial [Ignavibacteria bacterium]|nr:AAA family ATPase [Ignavibacteria bacterium]